jgi:hypothetical protein
MSRTLYLFSRCFIKQFIFFYKYQDNFEQSELLLRDTVRSLYLSEFSSIPYRTAPHQTAYRSKKYRII